MMQTVGRAALVLIPYALIGVGLWLVSPPVALIALGALFLLDNYIRGS